MRSNLNSSTPSRTHCSTQTVRKRLLSNSNISLDTRGKGLSLLKLTSKKRLPPKRKQAKDDVKRFSLPDFPTGIQEMDYPRRVDEELLGYDDSMIGSTTKKIKKNIEGLNLSGSLMVGPLAGYADTPAKANTIGN